MDEGFSFGYFFSRLDSISLLSLSLFPSLFLPWSQFLFERASTPSYLAHVIHRIPTATSRSSSRESRRERNRESQGLVQP
jgi:hypothetical protein